MRNCSREMEEMTIKLEKYILIFCFMGLLSTDDLVGQQQDFQSWWELNLDKGLSNGVDLSGEVEQRFRNNSLQYDRTMVTVAGDYDIKDYLNLAAGARALLSSDRELVLNTRYRLHMDVTGRYPLSRFDLSLRIRLQYGFNDLFLQESSASNNLINRYRVKASYKIFGTKLGWFASIEGWHPYTDLPNRLFNNIRYSAGAAYALNFRSELGIRYILEDEFNVENPLQSHILVFSYSHNL